MELGNYLNILRRRKWTIIVSTVATTLLVLIATYIATPIYVASTTIRVATIGSGLNSSGRPDINYTERLMNTYAQIVKSYSIQQQIVQQLALTEQPEILVFTIPNTELMQIQVEATDAIVAHNVANATAEILMKQSRELYSGGGQTTQDILTRQIAQLEEELAQVREQYQALLADSPDDSATIASLGQSIELKQRTYATLLDQYEKVRVEAALRANAVSVIEPALVPSAPAKPRHRINIALGFLVGLFGGIGLALLFENLDTTLYSTSQIEAVTDLSTLGQIPTSGSNLTIVHAGNGSQPQLEAFRKLRINVLASSLDSFPQTLMVTSAERAVGKSTVLANLAVTIAQSGRRVAVVDCNLHSPTIHTIFHLPNSYGLTNVLAEGLSPLNVLQSSEYPRLSVITSGPLLPDPADLNSSAQFVSATLVGQLTQGTELLGSHQMATMLEALQKDFDVILLDTPALLSVSDAAVLVPMVDDVVLVVARGKSSKEALRAVYRELNNGRTKSAGVVINWAETL